MLVMGRLAGLGLGQILLQRLEQPLSLGGDFLIQHGMGPGFLRFPIADSGIQGGAGGHGFGLQPARVLQGRLDVALPGLDDLDNRPIEKTLQYPQQNEEVEDFQQKGGPVEIHGGAVGTAGGYFSRYSSKGLRNRMISTTTST